MMTCVVSNRRGLYRSIESLVLASASPRREELLRSAGLSIDVIPSGIEETSGEGESPREMARRWAMEKAMAVSLHCQDKWVLGADTIVVLDGTVFGKPTDHEEAAAMLRSLSDRVHEVITGICLVHHRRRFIKSADVLTEVRFKALSDDEILAYVATGEPLDKAGAYGIQGRGAALVRSVQGSYTNVVGLPLCEILEWLLDQRVIAPGDTSSGS